MTGFHTQFKVRYAEIDGQKVVFNSRYLEYADVAVTEFYEWSRLSETLGAEWSELEFHVRRAEVDFLKPFVLGDTVEATCVIAHLGRSSVTKRVTLSNADSGDICCVVDLVSVNVDLASGRSQPLSARVREALLGFASASV